MLKFSIFLIILLYAQHARCLWGKIDFLFNTFIIVFFFSFIFMLLYNQFDSKEKSINGILLNNL